MRPWLLRPACVGSDSSRVFSGVSVVISSKPEIVMNLLPGLVGLNFLTGIFSLDAPEQAFDLLAGAERHDRLLPVGRLADRARPCAAKAAPLLAAHAHRVDIADLDVLRLVLLFESLLDLRLARGGRDLERVPALGVELVGALGDDRPDHDLARGSRRHLTSPSSRLLKFSSRSSIESFASNRYVCEKRSRTFRLRARTIFAPARFSNDRLTV